jgi:hypothetical protein
MAHIMSVCRVDRNFQAAGNVVIYSIALTLKDLDFRLLYAHPV